MSSTFSFLHLPPEVRNRIYAHYVTVKGGYVFNFESGKLVAASGDGKTQPIDQALKFTCRQVAEEMRGLDLVSNRITFSTGYSDNWRIGAAAFHHNMANINLEAYHWLQGPAAEESGDEEGDGGEGESEDQGGSLYQGQDEDENEDANEDEDESEEDDQEEDENDEPQLLPGFTTTIANEVAKRYPKFKPILDGILEGHNIVDMDDYFGIVPSYKRQATLYTLELQVKHNSTPEHWLGAPTHSPEEILALSREYQPWRCCLTGDEIRELNVGAISSRQSASYWKSPHTTKDGEQQYTQGKYRYSAAALAIRFLSRLPPPLRMCLRNIRLNENAVSVAYPECHAQGLIEFCIENPMLHVERRLDLWRNVFQSPSSEMANLTFTFEGRLAWSTSGYDGRGQGLWSLVLTDSIALWVTEALALIPLGMPEKSYTLVLDGGDVPQQCSDIFQTIVQRDAAWQTAWEMITSDTFSEESFFTKRAHHCYRFEGFPDAVNEMVNSPSGFIQCTFDTGPAVWNAEVEFGKYRHFSLEDSHNLPIANQVFFQPQDPLPGWIDLHIENILPEFFTDQHLIQVDDTSEWLIHELKGAWDDGYEDQKKQKEEKKQEIAKAKNERTNREMERLSRGFSFFDIN
ncbi:hypothetical protein CI102_15203 [Trichoderma harzianum]|nr:hypothetical protein CI102_15203 [Trichoderma harzianum]